MPSLALFDLDNTLLNREAALALWARSFIKENDLSNDNWPIIEKLDADGLTPKEPFFDEVRETFGITKDVKDLIASYNVKYPACYSIDEGTVRACDASAQAAGK
jgi:putative hydrolase of the HAD superfamily